MNSSDIHRPVTWQFVVRRTYGILLKGTMKLAFVTFKGFTLYGENNCLNACAKWRIINNAK